MECSSRRQWIGQVASAAVASMAMPRAWARPVFDRNDELDGEKIATQTREFIVRCHREDGSYGASPDVNYHGESDTKFSDLAGVTYAAVLARTMGWDLPRPDRSVEFIRRHQQNDGRFVNLAGKHDPASALGILYNTTQGVVGLRALGQGPAIDPLPVVERLLAGDAYKQLPWYTTSFFPLLCAAVGKPFPSEWRRKLASHMEQNQADDGYLGDHVAATFHMAHFYRLIGEPTPRAGPMVARVLRNQKADGGWNIKEPDWDVHACFDAVFILRQLGGEDPGVRGAIAEGCPMVAGLPKRGRRIRPFPRSSFRPRRGLLPVRHVDPGRSHPGRAPRSGRCPHPRLGPCDPARAGVWNPPVGPLRQT